MVENVENNIQRNMDELLSENHIYHTFQSVTNQFCEDISKNSLYVHNYFEIDLVVEGSGVHCVDDKVFPCKASDIYFISPGVSHEYFLTSHNEALIIRKLIFNLKDWFKNDASILGNKHYCYGVFDDGSTVAYAILDSSTREKVSYILDSIECELAEEEIEWISIVRTHLVQLFAYVGRYINRSIKNTPEISKENDTVCTTMKIVNEEFDDCELSLENISKRVYISTSKLSRSFKAYTGQLFSEYLREVRLNHSKRLLEEGDLSVEKIIEKCGFRDASAFYRNFRDFFGMTPQIYRKISRLSAERSDINTSNESEKKKMEILNDISINLQNGKAKVVKTLVQQAIDEGVSPADILNEGLLAGMSVVGEKFKNNEVFVPEVLVSARAMNMGAQILKPHLAANGVLATGKVCLGTVKGDLHDIGKNLVRMMMEGKGLEVIDLGVDVSAETFIKTAIEQNCRVICCSALLTTTMPVMEEVVKGAEAAGIRNKVKIMIGGAPVTQEYCDKIGADCYTLDAASAADAAVEFCKE